MIEFGQAGSAYLALLEQRCHDLSIAWIAAVLLSPWLPVMRRPVSQRLSQLALRLRRKLNRRSPVIRAYRGMVCVLFFVVLALLGGWIAIALRHVAVPIGEMAYILILALALPIADGWKALRKGGDSSPAPAALSAIAVMGERQVDAGDDAALRRAVIESAFLQLSRWVFAPSLCYLFVGAGGMLACQMVNLLARELGTLHAEQRLFGWGAARFHGLLQWVPSYGTVILIATASLFAPRTRPVRALVIGSRQPHARDRVLATVAGALDIALGGSRRWQSEVFADPWVGNGSAKLEMAHLTRARILWLIAALLPWLILTFISQKLI